MSWPDKAVREVAIAFLVELVLIALKATFHEFLSVPAAVVCKRGTDTVDLEIESTGTTQSSRGSPPNTRSCICLCVSLAGVGTSPAWCCSPTCREKTMAFSSEENTGNADS